MNYRTIKAAAAITVGIMVTGATPSLSDDAIRHISLGYDRFTTATPDPKNPSPSVIGAKYGFGGERGFKPYLGTGVAYTLLPEVKAGDTMKLKTGVSAQAGASYQLGGNLSLNLDYKYLYIAPEAQHGNAPPQSIGIGVNIKF
jgi:outer membrane protein W